MVFQLIHVLGDGTAVFKDSGELCYLLGLGEYFSVVSFAQGKHEASPCSVLGLPFLVGPPFSGWSVLHVHIHDLLCRRARQSSLPNSFQAIKNSFQFYLWAGLSAELTANSRKAYDEKANICFWLPNRQQFFSLPEAVRKKIGLKTVWLFLLFNFVPMNPSAQRGLYPNNKGKYPNKMALS